MVENSKTVHIATEWDANGDTVKISCGEAVNESLLSMEYSQMISQADGDFRNHYKTIFSKNYLACPTCLTNEI